MGLQTRNLSLQLTFLTNKLLYGLLELLIDVFGLQKSTVSALDLLGKGLVPDEALLKLSSEHCRVLLPVLKFCKVLLSQAQALLDQSSIITLTLYRVR